ncbi:MAG: hypothetical protein AB8H79_04910 [Myxococcota bacterium]
MTDLEGTWVLPDRQRMPSPFGNGLVAGECFLGVADVVEVWEEGGGAVECTDAPSFEDCAWHLQVANDELRAVARYRRSDCNGKTPFVRAYVTYGALRFEGTVSGSDHYIIDGARWTFTALNETVVDVDIQPGYGDITWARGANF